MSAAINPNPSELSGYEIRDRGGEPLARRGVRWARAHWKGITLAAIGLLAWRSRRLRPLVKTAVVGYALPAARAAVPAARSAIARVRA